MIDVPSMVLGFSLGFVCSSLSYFMGYRTGYRAGGDYVLMRIAQKTEEINAREALDPD